MLCLLHDPSLLYKMKLKLRLHRSLTSINMGFHCRPTLHNIRVQCRGVSEMRECNDKAFVSDLLEGRRWSIAKPDTSIHRITISGIEGVQGKSSTRFSYSNDTQPSLAEEMMIVSNKGEGQTSFYIARDDLLHPLVNGNKARKLDGLIPLLEDHSVTDVVTCGGCQSAHAAAVGVAAVSCAERGLNSHLHLRGEQPDILTGYNLISTMFGNTVYISRSEYAMREEMLVRHAHKVAGSNGCVIGFCDIIKASFPTGRSEEMAIKSQNEKHQKKVVIINEGAGDAVALLGLIRLVNYLSQFHLFGKEKPLRIIVDSGTGTTAVGLKLGSLCLGLPWDVTGVMLADTIEGYKKQEKHLISDFKRLFGSLYTDHGSDQFDSSLVHWVERKEPRKFGNVLKGEIEQCQQIAKQTGVLLDPIYTLSAWEHATKLCQDRTTIDTNILMLHTGGTLGMFGLAQRYKSFFHDLKTPIRPPPG